MRKKRKREKQVKLVDRRKGKDRKRGNKEEDRERGSRCSHNSSSNKMPKINYFSHAGKLNQNRVAMGEGVR